MLLSHTTLNHIRATYGDRFRTVSGQAVIIGQPVSTGTELQATLYDGSVVNRLRSGRVIYDNRPIGVLRIDSEGNILQFGRYDGRTSLRPARVAE